jgi:hypothetical protein
MSAVSACSFMGSPGISLGGTLALVFSCDDRGVGAALSGLRAILWETRLLYSTEM